MGIAERLWLIKRALDADHLNDEYETSTMCIAKNTFHFSLMSSYKKPEVVPKVNHPDHHNGWSNGMIETEEDNIRGMLKSGQITGREFWRRMHVFHEHVYGVGRQFMWINGKKCSVGEAFCHGECQDPKKCYFCSYKGF